MSRLHRRQGASKASKSCLVNLADERQVTHYQNQPPLARLSMFRQQRPQWNHLQKLPQEEHHHRGRSLRGMGQ